MSFLLDYNPGTQQWGYPRRGASLSGTAIIHTAECAMDLSGDDTSAEVCANFIANRSDYGSYHRLVDSDSIIDMVPWEYEAWQDSQTNPWAVGISAAVQAGNWHLIPADRKDRIYRNMAACAADFVNYMAGKGIHVPLRRISGAEARARVPGFCAHGDSGVSRSDPGAQFDWALFFEYTSQALSGGTITPASSIITQLEEAGMALTLDELQAIQGFVQTERETVVKEVRANAQATVDAVTTALDKAVWAIKTFDQSTDNENADRIIHDFRGQLKAIRDDFNKEG